MLEIITYPHPTLAKVAEPVEEITPELEALIKEMIEVMYEKDGVGLAAPQVDQSIRLICVDETGPSERAALKVLINPEIVECSGQADSPEGCLSVPGLSVTVKRKDKLTVRGQNEKGEDVCIKAEGYLAFIIQHEMDHLEGRTIVDHAGRLKRSMYEKKIAKWMKQAERGAK